MLVESVKDLAFRACPRKRCPVAAIALRNTLMAFACESGCRSYRCAVRTMNCSMDKLSEHMQGSRMGPGDVVAHDVRLLTWEGEECEFAEVGVFEPNVLALCCCHFDARKHPPATDHRRQHTVVQVFRPMRGDRFRVDPVWTDPRSSAMNASFNAGGPMPLSMLRMVFLICCSTSIANLQTGSRS